jgi:glycosyltransferase involved in cell wall biosynthesis
VIKIIYVVSSLKKSGPTEVLLNLINHLDRSFFLPIIITLSPEGRSSSIDNFNKINVEIIKLDLSRVYGILFIKKTLKSVLKFHHPDVIHTQGFRPDIIVSSFFNTYSFFSTIHNNPFEDYSFKFGKYFGFLIAHIHKRYVQKYPDSFIAVSDSVSKVYLKKKIQISSIQNGVNTDKFFPVASQKQESLKQKLSITTDKKIFLTSGRLVKSKNLVTTINGFNKFNTGDSILLIVGDGEEKDKLQYLESQDVRFIGYSNSILDFYQISDFFVSSSLTEGFPMAVLEAMAVGLVPILSNIEPHKEIFDDYSMPMFNPMSYLQLSDCLKEAETNQKKYKKLCLMLIESKFNAKVMSEKYQKKYYQAIN